MNIFLNYLIILVCCTLGYSKITNDPDCGTKGPKGLANLLGIRNGENSKYGEFPWMGILNHIEPEYYCGATILDKWWILTAHCVLFPGTDMVLDKEDFTFVGGKNFFLRPVELTNVFRGISSIYVYPGYGRWTKDGDVALLMLDESLKLNESVFDQLGTICLPDEPFDIDHMAGKECIALGWGRTDKENTKGPINLQKASSKIWKQSDCKRSGGKPATDRQLCWGTLDVGTCSGDSGGLLLCRNDNRWYQYGVSSFIIGTAQQPCRKSVFARTSHLSEWIFDTMDKHS